jgi:hypothetical protein
MLVERVACRVAATAADRECQRALPRGIFILLRTGRGTGAQSRRQSVRTPRPRRLQDRSVLRHGLTEFGDFAMMRRMQLGIKELRSACPPANEHPGFYRTYWMTRGVSSNDASMAGQSANGPRGPRVGTSSDAS